jgi:polyribonucleotide nucleotidyltransferase
MIPELANLSNSEAEIVLKSPILCCILIAGADNEIDQKEIKKAIALSQKKMKRTSSRLQQFYQVLGEDFEDKFKIILQEYPVEITQRELLLISDLSTLNNVMPKLDRSFAKEFYASLLEIAGEIAKSSGGVLGVGKIGPEEARYVQLPMIKSPV